MSYKPQLSAIDEEVCREFAKTHGYTLQDFSREYNRDYKESVACMRVLESFKAKWAPRVVKTRGADALVFFERDPSNPDKITSKRMYHKDTSRPFEHVIGVKYFKESEFK